MPVEADWTSSVLRYGTETSPDVGQDSDCLKTTNPHRGHTATVTLKQAEYLQCLLWAKISIKRTDMNKGSKLCV